MSSLVPPPFPVKGVSIEKSPKLKSARKKVAPTRSARRVKNGAVSTGTDVTHVVKVTVLGLAGITVDRSKCRYSPEDEDLPASPSKMRAVVAFSRNSVIKGTTTLSKPLTRSPNEDVVLATPETEEEVPFVAKSASGDDAATQTTGSTGGSTRHPPRRHLAVWVSEDRSLGSAVTFEANLHRSDMGVAKNAAASSAFAPKSFDLTIGLTEGYNSDQAAVALPLGVASLAVSGNESTNGESVIVDLPVWSLSQARPLSSSDGMGGYPLITLASRQNAVTDGIHLKKKRTGLQRLFSKKDRNGNIAASFPSKAERDAFSAAYSMDSAGDAILRVSLEVHEKIPATNISEDRPVKDSKTHKKVSNRPGSPVGLKGHETDSYDDVTYDSDEGTELTDETEYTDEYTDYTGSIITAEDETITLDDSIVTTEDDRMVFFSWVNRPDRPSHGERERERRAGKRSDRSSLRQDPRGAVSMTVLGHQVRIPACGSVDDGRSTSGDSREDMTHVTADFFGESYQIPLCRGVAKKEGDDSTTTFSEQSSASDERPRIMDFMNGAFCQSNGRSKQDLKNTSTFSTLSENPPSAKGPTAKDVVVMKDEKIYSVEGSFLSDEAKMPKVPDEPSEVDDIMRIVEGKQTINRSPNDLGAQTQVTGEKTLSKEQKNSATDISPKGVEDFEDIEADDATIPGGRIFQNISEMLQCSYPEFNGNGPRYEPFEPKIPPVIIRSETDMVSVGELTATTHERNIASEEQASDARLLERARQMLNESKRNTKKERDAHKRIPIPSCGGNGICSSMVRRDTTSSPIRLGLEDTFSILEGEKSQHAQEERAVNPAVDKDDCTTFSPIEVEKVSSEEKGTTFSRVRNPSADKREEGKAQLSHYSESLPVYESMKGDESESIIGAFVESPSNDRELFNPITGQEVNQAFL